MCPSFILWVCDPTEHTITRTLAFCYHHLTARLGSRRPIMESIRLSKLMAQKGMCSRREADQLIEQGWVYVDGEVVDRLGSKVKPSQQISLSPQAKGQQRRLATILLNKPLGYVSGQPEKGYQPAASLITAQNYYCRSGKRVPTPRTLRLPGLAPAGRLDIDSQGLLVLTQDGRIARQLISPQSDIEKQYQVRVRRHITASKVSQL